MIVIRHFTYVLRLFQVVYGLERSPNTIQKWNEEMEHYTVWTMTKKPQEHILAMLESATVLHGLLTTKLCITSTVTIEPYGDLIMTLRTEIYVSVFKFYFYIVNCIS